MKRILTFNQLFEGIKPDETTWMPTDAVIARSPIYSDLGGLISGTDSYIDSIITDKQRERNVRVISFEISDKIYKLEPNSDNTINVKYGRETIIQDAPFTTQEQIQEVLIDLMIHAISVWDTVWRPNNMKNYGPNKNPFYSNYKDLKSQLERGDTKGLLDGITDIVTNEFGLREERLVRLVLTLMWHLRSINQQRKGEFIKQLIVNLPMGSMLRNWSTLIRNLLGFEPFVSIPEVDEGLAISLLSYIKNDPDAIDNPKVTSIISGMLGNLEWIKIR